MISFYFMPKIILDTKRFIDFEISKWNTINSWTYSVESIEPSVKFFGFGMLDGTSLSCHLILVNLFTQIFIFNSGDEAIAVSVSSSKGGSKLSFRLSFLCWIFTICVVLGLNLWWKSPKLCHPLSEQWSESVFLSWCVWCHIFYLLFIKLYSY